MSDATAQVLLALFAFGVGGFGWLRYRRELSTYVSRQERWLNAVLPFVFVAMGLLLVWAAACGWADSN